jgi:hypothetical protein
MINIANLFKYSYKNNTRLTKYESIIAKNPFYAYDYAKNVVKGRFTLGETMIAKDDLCSYRYAIEVIKQRFPLGEISIIKNKIFIYRYQQLLKCKL